MTEEQLQSKGELVRAFPDFTVKIYEYPGVMSGEIFSPDIMGAARQFLGMRLPPDPAKAS